MLWHLAGGEGGIRHFMEHLMHPLAAMMKTLGNPEVTTELQQTLIGSVMQEVLIRQDKNKDKVQHTYIMPNTFSIKIN